MSELLQQSLNADIHNPVRNYGIPQNPIPQTNTGLLEHTGIPLEPQEQITDLQPDFSWMMAQFKYIGQVQITASKDKVGAKLLQIPVLAYPTKFMPNYHLPNWHKLPFSTAVWWDGIVSFRFTIIKPPRVVGKLLIRYRQDAFGDWLDDGQAKNVPDDTTYRSILKEWDLAESNQFEFDVTGCLPIRARPTKYNKYDVGSDSKTGSEIANVGEFCTAAPPWIENHMGTVWIEVAQELATGSIFPDSYTILIEKAFKNTNFMTPTDSKSTYRSVIRNEFWQP